MTASRLVFLSECKFHAILLIVLFCIFHIRHSLWRPVYSPWTVNAHISSLNGEPFAYRLSPANKNIEGANITGNYRWRAAVPFSTHTKPNTLGWLFSALIATGKYTLEYSFSRMLENGVHGGENATHTHTREKDIETEMQYNNFSFFLSFVL